MIQDHRYILEWSIYKVLKKRQAYFNALRKASEEYQAANWPRPFVEWLADFYGIEVEWDDSNTITEKYKIVDEQKYMLFVLKFYS